MVLAAERQVHRLAQWLQLRVSSIQSESPVEYFEGIIQETDGRDADLRSIDRLLDLIRPLVMSGGEVQLYPIWDLEEHKPPKGTIEMPLASLNPGTFSSRAVFASCLAA